MDEIKINYIYTTDVKVIMYMINYKKAERFIQAREEINYV